MKNIFKAFAVSFCMITAFIFVVLSPTNVKADANVSFQQLPLNDDMYHNADIIENSPVYYKFTIPEDGTVTVTIQTEVDRTGWNVTNTDLDYDGHDYWHESWVNGSDTSPKTRVGVMDLSAGTYGIRIYDGNSNGVGGRVGIKVAFKSSGSIEATPNNTFETAQQLPEGVLTTAMLTSINDPIDFYVITVPRDSQVDIKFTNYFGRVYYNLYAANRDHLYGNTMWDGSENSPKVYTHTHTLTAGTYFIKIEGSSTGVYQIEYSNSVVASVTFDQTDLILNYGDQYTLQTYIAPENATNKKLVWASSNENIVTVNENGTIYTQSPGTAVVTATTTDGSNITTSCNVTVRPTKVGGLYAEKQKSTSIKLNWYSISNVDGYTVFKYNKKQKTFIEYKTINGYDNTTCNVKKLNSETLYKFQVKAFVISNGQKLYGDESDVLKAYTAPKKLKTTHLSGKVVKLGRIYKYKVYRLRWNKVKGATGYKVYYRTASTNWSYYTTTSNRTYDFSFSKGYKYYFKVVPYRTKNGLTTDGKASNVIKKRF